MIMSMKLRLRPARAMFTHTGTHRLLTVTPIFRMPTIGIRTNDLQLKTREGFIAMHVAVPTLASSLLLCTTVASAVAQQAIYQSPSLTPNAALKAAQAALEACRKNGHQAAVSVNDRAGNA